MEDLENKIFGAYYGEAIGDALGVPVEFKSRSNLAVEPVTDFIGYKCWNQPPGTFSDDSSMMFCTAESLLKGYDLQNIATLFVKWYKEGYWGAHDKLFDIGGTTRRSLDRVFNGEDPKFSGEFDHYNNGNGSLMRILPFVFHLLSENDLNRRHHVVREVSSITHAHFRSIFACFIYVELGISLAKNETLLSAYDQMQESVKKFAISEKFNPDEVILFNKILNNKIWEYNEEEIASSGYVIDSLESSLWCLYTTKSYSEAVLKAVNLGGDTDTTGAITGGIAGLYYGYNNLRNDWVERLAKTKEIERLCLQTTELIKKTL